ncbi:radical SAM family heme chaperone HemW [Porphyromonas crevioricanis]|uniref:radical SAM family heme chaperone HemW n=1 Tax=Porphyromonas crevioricanis TaxID=393921 RepID=UPI0005A9F8C3|nr:radical SAM family heme chaperone HemW [Porphyromonas crevioricanis]
MYTYLHIPFCPSRCIYCDFYSQTKRRLIPEYVKALMHEIRYRHEKQTDLSTLQSIYFGGGTPSQLQPEHIARLIDLLEDVYGIEEKAEITLEANPEDLTAEYVEQIAALPINRISMGIQSWQDKDLHFLRRRHTAKSAESAVKRCQDAGLDNISLDLIYGLPQQTLPLWQKNLQQTIALHPRHISAYHLIYEEGTPLYHLLSTKQISEIDEELSLDLFSCLIDTLSEAGYEQYEISNFAQKGYRAVHNSAYWQGKPYMGFGPAAHSYDGRTCRRANTPDLDLYLHATNRGEDSPHTDELLSPTDLINEAVLCGLRTVEGLMQSSFVERFGKTCWQQIRKKALPYLQKGLLEENSQGIKLSREGIFLSDTIMSDLFC